MKKSSILCGTVLCAIMAYAPITLGDAKDQATAQKIMTAAGTATVTAGAKQVAIDVLGAPGAGVFQGMKDVTGKVTQPVTNAVRSVVNGSAFTSGTEAAGAATGSARGAGSAAKGSGGAKCNAVVPGAAGSHYHTPIFGYTFDISSAASRLLSTAIKYFLGDDTELVAQLVWKDDTGAGGAYTAGEMQTGVADLQFAAVMNEISVEDNLYRDGITVGTECVPSLAQDRLDGCIVNQASLNELNARAWYSQYQAQRRSIQALTDALNMKRLYKNIKNIATSVEDRYANYAQAMGTVASKRLLLDQLLALKKQVVAARVRVRAQTLELSSVDAKLVTAAPDLKMICNGYIR